MAEPVSKDTHVNGSSEENVTIKVEKVKNEPLTDQEINIIEQIEYYFGDCNLPKDKFLQEEIKKDDGWVLLSTMLKFNRLSKISSDSNVIAAAIKKSQSGLMEVSEDETKIRRNPSQVLPELNEGRRQELMKRSVYVKGFPLVDVEIDTLLQYFKKYTKIDQLIMRKYLDKATKKYIFKGSVYAVLPTVDDVDKLIKQAPLHYEETELIIKPQNVYIEEKRKDRLQLKIEDRKRKAEDRHRKGDKEGDEEDDDEKKDVLPKGASLFLSDCPEELTREELKSALEGFGITVAFVYFCKGDKEGWIRLQNPNSAIELTKNLKDGKLKVNDNITVTIKVLEGEEETKFLDKAKDDMAKRKNQNKRFKPNRKGKRGGGYHGRKRRSSPNRFGDGPPRKKQLVEEND